MTEEIDIIPQRIGFFQDSPDSWSMMRLIFFLLAIWFIILTGYITYFDKWTVLSVSFMSGYLATILGAKALQKKFEK